MWKVALRALLFALWAHSTDALLLCYAYFGFVDDFGWTYAQNVAREAIDARFGSQSKYVEGVHILFGADWPFPATERQIEIYQSFMDDGCDFVISGSSLLEAIAVMFAKKYPERIFLNIGGLKEIAPLPNAASVFCRMYQARYIAGVAAASTPDVTRLGYIGSLTDFATGGPIPESARDINAFLLGARSVNPDIEVDTIYTGSWFAPRAEEIAGMRLWKNHSVNALTYDSDSDTACANARMLSQLPPNEPNPIFAIGHKMDCGLKHSSSALTSTLYQYEQIISELITAAQDGTWSNPMPNLTTWHGGTLVKDKNTLAGFEKNALGIGAFSQFVPFASKKHTKDVIEQFASGWDRVFCPASGEFKDNLGKVHRIADDPLSRNGCFSDAYLFEGMTWFLEGINFHGQLDVPSECLPGTYIDPLASQLCVTCPPGKFSGESEQTACDACPPGTYNDGSGATACMPCFAGMNQSEQGQTFCKECPPGTFSNGLAATCTACPIGTFRNETGGKLVTSCRFCDRGKYASTEHSTSCSACAALMTTRDIAANSPSFCICNIGAYLKDGRCVACPSGSITNEIGQTSAMSCLCEAGTFMAMDNLSCAACPSGSTTSGIGKTSVVSCLCKADTFMPMDKARCEPCKVGMTCMQGSSEANYYTSAILLHHSARSAEERIPMLAPGYWSELSDRGPLSVFACRSDRKCRGGDPVGNRMCAQQLQTRACEHCELGYQWQDNSCVKCTDMEASRFIFPILPTLLVFIVIVGMYSRFKDDFSRWGHWRNACGCIAFILLNHYQVLDFMGSADITLPEVLSDTLQIWTFTNNLAALFEVECAGTADFSGQMIIGAISPLCVIVAALVIYCASLVASRLRPRVRMEENRLLNIVGSLMYTFFTAISGMAFSLFKCGDNPNGLNTNASDYSVVCFESDDWKQMFGLAIACVFIYVVCLGSTFVWAVIVAPHGRFKSLVFQTRWKFLFIKYHSEAYYWSIIHLLKNLALNLCFVIFTSGVQQLFCAQTVLMVYGAGVYFVRPYRSESCNTLEMIVLVCLLYGVCILSFFSARAKNAADFDDELAYTQMIISFVPILLGGCMVQWLMYWGAFASEKKHDNSITIFNDVFQSMHAFAVLSQEDAIYFWHNIAELDQALLRRASRMLKSELQGIGSIQRVASGRISFDSNATATSNDQDAKENPKQVEAFDSKAFATSRDQDVTAVALLKRAKDIGEPQYTLQQLWQIFTRLSPPNTDVEALMEVALDDPQWEDSKAVKVTPPFELGTSCFPEYNARNS